MYRYNKNKISWIFSICLVLGVVIFSALGTTFAYFQIKNTYNKEYTMSSVGASWCTAGKVEFNAENFGGKYSTYGTNIAMLDLSDSKLLRGNEEGVAIEFTKSDNTKARGLYIKPKDLTEGLNELVRIRCITGIIDEGGTTFIEDSALLEHLTFKWSDGTDSYILGEENDEVWASVGGWIYCFSVFDSTTLPVLVADTLVAKASLPATYLKQHIAIRFELETIQANRSAVQAEWGTEAYNLLFVD